MKSSIFFVGFLIVNASLLASDPYSSGSWTSIHLGAGSIPLSWTPQQVTPQWEKPTCLERLRQLCCCCCLARKKETPSTERGYSMSTGSQTDYDTL
jgi:hypothetical protein